MDNKQYTMRYFGLTEKQCDRFMELSQMPIKDYPQKLTYKLQQTFRKIGFSGDVLFETIAEYVKYENNVGDK